jgi:hypothetical protein
MSAGNAVVLKAMEPGDLGKMEATASNQSCSLNSCLRPTAVVLAGQNLCLEHFFEWCYQRLEELDCKVHRKQLELTHDENLRGLVEECSNRALAVSLQHEPLTNQDRSRLLDILLWCGDLQYVLRSPQAELCDSAGYLSKRYYSAVLPRAGRR